MLERLRSFEDIKHKGSGKPFSVLQKLTLYMGAQRRNLSAIKALLTRVAAENPTVALQTSAAARAISAVEDALEAEYERDRTALRVHAQADGEPIL